MLKSSSVEELEEIAKEKNFLLIWEESADINFDNFWISLNNLRERRASTSNTCTTLLNGWNFLEDLGRTFNIAQVKSVLSTSILQKIYEKLFYGCNIGAENLQKTYSPLWTRQEINEIRKKMRLVWAMLEKYLE